MEIDELIPRVRTYARSIPDPTARRAVIVALQRMCKRTSIWTGAETLNVTKPLEQSVAGDQDRRVIGIKDAYLNDIALTPVTVDTLDKAEPLWPFSTDVDQATPNYIVSPAPDLIAIYPAATGTLKARFIFEPTESAFTIPDFFGQHAETIAYGASAIAMLMPATDFSNPELAAVNEARFQSAIDTLMMQVFRSTTRATPRVRPRFF